MADTRDITAIHLYKALAKARFRELEPLAESIGINPMQYSWRQKYRLAIDIANTIVDRMKDPNYD